MIVVSAQSVEHGGKTFAELIDGGKIKSDVDSAFQSGGKESYAKFRFNLALEQYELAQKIMKAPDFDFDDKQGREPVLSLLLGARDSATGKRNGMGAFNHFINIFINCPESKEAFESVTYADEIQKILVDKFGGKVNNECTIERMAKVQYFRIARFATDGKVKESAEAFEWLRKNAIKGNAAAQLYLGVCYEHGTGVEKDEAKAVEWHRKAAEQGLSYAQVVVGIEFVQGKGVDKDLDSAIFWFKKAADQGDKDAEEILRELGAR